MLIALALLAAVAVVCVGVVVAAWAVLRARRREARRASEALAPVARECSLCGWECTAFATGLDGEPEAVCPCCRSLPLERLAWLYLVNETALHDGRRRRRVLLVGCGEPLLRRLADEPLLDCVMAELSCGFDVFDAPFDVVLCGSAALGGAELGGVLRPGGWALELAAAGANESARGHAAAGLRVIIDSYPERVGDAERERLRLPANVELLLCRRPLGGGAGAVERVLATGAGEPAQPLNASGVKPGVLGRVEEVREGCVSGWAWHPSRPTWRVGVRVLIDGKEVAAGLADRPRPSLAREGVGDGVYGFELQLPETVARRGLLQLRVETETGCVLGPVPGFRCIGADGSRWPGVQFRIETGTDGRIESVQGGYVTGWAWQPADPDRPVGLQVIVGGRTVATGEATLLRPLPTGAGVFPGRRSFRLRLPDEALSPGCQCVRIETQDGLALPAAMTLAAAAADDEPISAAAHFSVPSGDVPAGPSVANERFTANDGRDTGRQGRRAPVPRPPNVVRGRVESVHDSVVSGWAFRPAAPTWRVGVRVMVDGCEVADGVAHLTRPSLQAEGIGDGRHGFQVPLPARLLDHGAHLVTVTAEGVGLPLAAAFGAKRPSEPREFPTFVDGAPAPTVPAVAGTVERINTDEVSGWAWYPVQPARRVVVRLLLDGCELDTAVAELPHSGLAHMPAGDGRYGFRLRLPARSVGTLEVRTGEGVTLPLATDVTSPQSDANDVVVGVSAWRCG